MVVKVCKLTHSLHDKEEKREGGKSEKRAFILIWGIACRVVANKIHVYMGKMGMGNLYFFLLAYVYGPHKKRDKSNVMGFP